MAYPDVKEGVGTTLVCATSSWTCEITDVKRSGPKYDSIDVTKLSSTVAKEFIRSQLYDPGELDLTIHYNPDNEYPLTNTGETFTLLYPSIGTATATNARSRTAMGGFILESPHSIPNAGKIMEGSMKVKLTGAPTHTATT